MVAIHAPQGLVSKLIPAVAVLAGIGVAAGIATAPGETLDALVALTGAPRFYPTLLPVGVATRVALALLGGLAVIACGAAPAWFMRSRPGSGPSDDAADAPEEGGEAEPAVAPILPPPSVRRADAHPDAPPRRPIRASSDLGAPLPIVVEGKAKHVTFADASTSARETPAAVEETPSAPPLPMPRLIEAPLPANLDQPLAAFDPAAIPAVPRPRPEVLAPLVRPAPVPAETQPEPDPAPVETFEPRPTLRAAEAPEDEEPAESIAALLARLERGRAARRAAAAMPVPPAPSAPAETLDATLSRLRQLAAR